MNEPTESALEASASLPATDSATPSCTYEELEVTLYDERGTLAGRRRLTPTRYHDCEYVRLRNALIPEADHRARRTAVAAADREKRMVSPADYTRAFFEHMEALVRERLR